MRKHQLTPEEYDKLVKLHRKHVKRHERSKLKHPDLLAYLAIMGGVETLVLFLWLWHVGVL